METWGLTGFDFGFATYVDPRGLRPVPEAATFGLSAALALMLLIGIRRVRGRPDAELQDGRAGTGG